MKTVSEQMVIARKAQEAVANYTQEQIDEVCLAIGWEVYEDANIATLAHMAVEETGFGNVPSKITKHKRKIGGVLHDIQHAKSVGCIERNEADGISKYAKPVGVVCAILPATNPAAKICSSKLFDYATSCSSENAVIPVAAVYDAFMSAMQKRNCYLVSGADRENCNNICGRPMPRARLVLTLIL